MSCLFMFSTSNLLPLHSNDDIISMKSTTRKSFKGNKFSQNSIWPLSPSTYMRYK